VFPFIMSRLQGVWAFALLACLDRVLLADTTAVLRQLMRRHLSVVKKVCPAMAAQHLTPAGTRED
jgi:hypothetical protein